MRPGPSGSPGSASSSPVTSTATRGRRAQASRPRPTDAATPSSAGPSTVPRRRTTSPARTSSPARRTLSPSSDASTRTRSPARSVRSTGTTAVAPSGTAAPVEMRIAVPGPAGRRRPAGARLADHLELGLAARDHGVAVHRGAVERRDVDRALDVLGEHPAERRAERDLLAAERPHGGEHPLPRLLDRDQLSHRANLRKERQSRTLRLSCRPPRCHCARSGRRAVIGGRIGSPPRESGAPTDRRRMTPIRGPLARLDRSRDELAKAWLVRLIERASLDEISELPTERIARELPELISDIVGAVAEPTATPTS